MHAGAQVSRFLARGSLTMLRWPQPARPAHLWRGLDVWGHRISNAMTLSPLSAGGPARDWSPQAPGCRGRPQTRVTPYVTTGLPHGAKGREYFPSTTACPAPGRAFGVVPWASGSRPWPCGEEVVMGKEPPLPKTKPAGIPPLPTPRGNARERFLQSAGPTAPLPILHTEAVLRTERLFELLQTQNSNRHSPAGARSLWGAVQAVESRGAGRICTPAPTPALVWPRTEHAYFKTISIWLKS